MSRKRELGQYYTQTNPFTHPLFREWMGLGVTENMKILEPFAGSNNIVRLIEEAGYGNAWVCYDIDPPSTNTAPKYKVEYRDTIKNFPTGYNVCITNPPYLGKSSARRRHIDYPWEEDDLYKVCLNIMLSNCDYVAAIIPESFITAGIHLDRLWGVISLACKMFDDTDCPVCLALFTKDGNSDVQVYLNEVLLGSLSELQRTSVTASTTNIKWVFNDKDGEIGAKTIDSQKAADCSFFEGEKIDPNSIKVSSRSFTRVSGLPNDIDRTDFLSKCNELLKKYREETMDVMMTSFKGLRVDGKYRRRLDFKAVRDIMNKAVEELRKEGKLAEISQKYFGADITAE